MSTKQKVKEAGVSGLLKLVENSEPKTFEKAKEHDIDTKALASKVVVEYKEFSAPVGASYLAAAIRRAISEADSTQVNGMLLGARDSYGRKMSMNIAVVNPKGETFEVSSWDTKISVDGIAQDVQYPTIAKLNVVEEQFTRKDGSTASNLKLLSITDAKPVSAEDLAAKLAPMAIVPSEVTDEDCRNYRVVILKGVISSITAADRWENGSKCAQPHPLVENNELNVSHPVFVVNLAKTTSEGVAEPTSTRVTFGQRRFTSPSILDEDTIRGINSAIKKYPNDPVSQAREVSAGFHLGDGKAVLIVGTASRLNAAKDKNGNMNQYLDVSGYTLVEYPEASDDTPVASHSPSKKKEKTPSSSNVNEAPKEIADHMEKINDYCNTFGISPAELTRDKVVTDILGKGIRVGVVDDALSRAREAWVA
jgi:signal recognition particle subunit SEC65